MGNMKRVVDYVNTPHIMLLDLADMARGNERLARMWQRNYLRVADEKRA
ncbi:hypothetical protein PghCCS26_47230 [Paenibacillus glycanilyticus]|uniref:Uncharacterized protein n=1 Tax=Paenibacillus glycanilyticus TaxID=126569 RepID=A0ABQ6NR77_9BACL|nr:hypothetical protein [Paenibacillus glycanilyticus]GMK47593.1 hypothetical protein PghCCS26_47230 [Paenibacillus glycanilyticus]